MKPPNPDHAAYRRQFARATVRAAYLQTKGRLITAKIAAIVAEKAKAAA